MEPGERFDVILVGAGIIGSSLAMALAERGAKTLAVEVDLSGRLSSSEKNAGGVRATWWQPVNITLCRASISYYESIAGQIGFRQKGYLWLYKAETWPKAEDRLALQRGLGQPIEAHTARQVSERVPEIDRRDAFPAPPSRRATAWSTRTCSNSIAALARSRRAPSRPKVRPRCLSGVPTQYASR